MQGLQSLDQFKDFVSSIGGLGRYEDTYMVHAAEGETVVPMEVLDKNPLLKKRLFKTMMKMGIEPGRYIVGNELNSKNPVTGQPEFFLKKIGRRLRKAAADISGYAAPIIGAMYGAPAGALAGGLLGQYKRENPGDPTQGLNMALRGGAAGLATNLLSGQPLMQMGGGFRGLGGAGKDAKFGIKSVYDNFMKNKGDFKISNVLDKFKFDGKTSGGGGIKLSEEEIKTISDMPEGEKILEILNNKEKGLFGDMSVLELAKLYGLGTAGLGLLLDKTSSDGPVGMTLDEMPEGQVKQGIVNPLLKRAQGGVMDLQDGGESKGPGTGTSDSIPAMLSDGEFVMTAKAVRGAGGGDRREGAKKMYEAMDKLEAQA
jgi:hypothetical protein